MWIDKSRIIKNKKIIYALMSKYSLPPSKEKKHSHLADSTVCSPYYCLFDITVAVKCDRLVSVERWQPFTDHAPKPRPRRPVLLSCPGRGRSDDVAIWLDLCTKQTATDKDKCDFRWPRRWKLKTSASHNLYYWSFFWSTCLSGFMVFLPFP